MIVSCADGHKYSSQFTLAEVVAPKVFAMADGEHRLTTEEMPSTELREWAQRLRVPVALVRVALAALVVPMARVLLCEGAAQRRAGPDTLLDMRCVVQLFKSDQ